jgi:mono/diheme cytochrome c family protein
MPSVDQPQPAKPGDPPEEPMLQGKTDEVQKQIAAVALFLSTEGDEKGERKDPVDPVARALGEKIVTDTCTSCHLYKGDGDANGQGEAPELSGYGSIAWTRAQVGNPGTPATYREHAGDSSVKGLMPHFDAELSPADIDLVARWTRAKARGVSLE